MLVGLLVAVVAHAAGDDQCETTLVRLCGEQASADDCGRCAAAHQQALRVAMCESHDIEGFCMGNCHRRAESGQLCRRYASLAGGDCCPMATNCSGGSGPYAVSTGGDYPESTGLVCDDTTGCVAFGQMKSFVTHYYFSSKETCKAAQSAPAHAGGMNASSWACSAEPVGPDLEYWSTKEPVPSKMPWTCFASWPAECKGETDGTYCIGPPDPLLHLNRTIVNCTSGEKLHCGGGEYCGKGTGDKPGAQKCERL